MKSEKSFNSQKSSMGVLTGTFGMSIISPPFVGDVNTRFLNVSDSCKEQVL